MTTTPAPEKYSDEMLDIILNHASSPACCAPKSSLREYIPTLVAMAKHGQKSRNAYTTNLVAERDALKEKVWMAAASTNLWVEVAASRTHELEILKEELLDAKTELANIDMALSNRSALDGCTSRSGKVGLACSEAGRYHDLAGKLEAQVKVLLAQLEESRLRKHSLETENETCAKDHTDLRDLFRGLPDRFLLDKPTLRMKVVHIISENSRLTKELQKSQVISTTTPYDYARLLSTCDYLCKMDVASQKEKEAMRSRMRAAEEQYSAIMNLFRGCDADLMSIQTTHEQVAYLVNEHKSRKAEAKKADAPAQGSGKDEDKPNTWHIKEIERLHGVVKRTEASAKYSDARAEQAEATAKQLAMDALVALSAAGHCTPAEGYLKSPQFFRSDLVRALKPSAKSIAAAPGELKQSLYVLEREDGSIVLQHGVSRTRVLVCKSLNEVCERIIAMEKQGCPHQAYLTPLVTAAQVRQLDEQIPMLRKGHSVRLAPSTA